VAVVALIAVVIGAFVADLAVGAEPGPGTIPDEAGISLAVGADSAGTYVALFLPASRPV
jgi:hypothetical protein